MIAPVSKRTDLRVCAILGEDGVKPRYNAIVSIVTAELSSAQLAVEHVLDDFTIRWTLDELVTSESNVCGLYYLIRSRKRNSRTSLLTAIRARTNGYIESVRIEEESGIAVEVTPSPPTKAARARKA